MKDLCAVIPARLGSSRIKQKMLLPFNGYSLLEWKIKQLKTILPNKNIFVSTESDILKEIAYKNKINIHERESYLSQGHEASFSEVITGIVKDLDFKHIAWITAVVPLMSPKEYAQAFDAYEKYVCTSDEYDSLFSANLLKEYFWNDAKAINYQANKNHTISQELPNIYRVTNGLYMRDKKSILKDKYFLGKKPLKFCVSKIAGIDIDEYEDYEIAKTMLKIYKNLHTKIKGK
ncbi:acylneuraminate cytidylyltransferase [Campylobacter sp. MIT 12-8780]|uniref:acylneuraminate cytidylyltransferase family protein n=1 Tax=unclassified Campylobacter TaxID=2593542 RepID=UPI00115DF626|nr:MULTISPECIES: acylneuraminate cytidylyltransferase [unclassified Campylobacter]NDJ26621.1 acylneuraminate cytidylyltransferase [Campylobacter sp. MIT 19-121]TQR43181.1 acylneuraminate cytidylyltransferase [Campylobacter sp. MIT 12-8780]